MLVQIKNKFKNKHWYKRLASIKNRKTNRNKTWYPEKLRVGDAGTPATYEFMETAFQADEPFSYAEFGIYKGATALKVNELFPNCEIYLFDFEKTLNDFKKKDPSLSDRFHYFGNSQKYNDSYNWSLMKLIKVNQNHHIFDYCFFDGAHTVAVDALNFFLADKLLKVGGYMDFDDYNWKIRGSSLDPKFVPEIGDQYTDEQIDSEQVRMIIETLVRPDNRYEEVVINKIFKKVSI